MAVGGVGGGATGFSPTAAGHDNRANHLLMAGKRKRSLTDDTLPLTISPPC